MKLLITIFAILVVAIITTAAKVEKKVDKKLNLAKEKRESQTGSSYLYLPPSGSGGSHGIGAGHGSHGIGGSSHGSGVSVGGGHGPISYSHGGGAGLGLGGHGPTVDTFIIEQVGGHGHSSGAGIGGGRGHFGGAGLGFGSSFGHSKYIAPNLGSSGHHYNIPTVVIPSQGGHGLSDSFGYNGGFSHGGLSSIGGGYSGRNLGHSNGLIGSGYSSYSSGGFGGNHGGVSSLGGLGGHGGSFGRYNGGVSSFGGLGGHNSGISTTYGVPYAGGHSGHGGSQSSFGGGALGGVSYQNYDLYSGGHLGGSFGSSHSGSLGESQLSLGNSGAHQSFVVPTGSYGTPLAPPINSYTPAYVSSALSFGTAHDSGAATLSSSGNTFGYEAPQYAAGHKGLRHYHSGENQHAVIESKPIALTGGSELHTSISPSQAPFKPSAFLGATQESSGLAHNYGASAVQQQPQQHYRIETQEYSVPAQEYGAPSGSGNFGGSYENVNDGYTSGAIDNYSNGGSYTQGTGFGVTGTHGTPSGSYLPASSGLPANSYLPPSSSYGAPSNGHH